MTEGSSGPTQLVRQAAQVGRHQVISIGPLAVDEPRVEIQELARTDPVYEYEDARRWRVFGRILSRDHLLPYMKSRRSEIRDTHSELDASRYTALAEFVAWLYTSAAAEATTQLAASGRIVSPETSFRYALRSDR